jgi:hypothetical protein
LGLFNRPRYARVFGLCRLLEIENIYDIGCGINGQAVLLANLPDVFYTGIDVLDLKEILSTSACRLFKDRCGERIKFQQGYYPFEIISAGNNIAVCLGWSPLLLEHDDREEFCRTIERDFERVLLSCSGLLLAETELKDFTLHNIGYMSDYGDEGYLIFGTKFPDEITMLKEMNYCHEKDMDSIHFFGKQLMALLASTK